MDASVFDHETALRSLRTLCADVGNVPEWVQGPGGNASVKLGDVLWVKASETWLSRALDEEILVPVDLGHARASIEKSSSPTSLPVLDNRRLRPSIETTLHAVMPHRYVLHVHSVNALSFAIRKEGAALLAEVFGDDVPWAWVPYAKPGVPLTRCAQAALNQGRSDYLVLANHGVVLGADTAEGLSSLLDQTERAMARAIEQQGGSGDRTTDEGVDGGVGAAYEPRDALGEHWRAPVDRRVHALALRQDYRTWLQMGALYPDHTVFLGADTFMTSREAAPAALAAYQQRWGQAPPYAIVPGRGVAVNRASGPTVDAMLLCWRMVLDRLPRDCTPVALSPAEVSELVDWDAEKHRRAVQPIQERRQD